MKLKGKKTKMEERTNRDKVKVIGEDEVITDNLSRLLDLMKTWDIAAPYAWSQNPQPQLVDRGAWNPLPRLRGTCNFCKKNGEPREVYSSHQLRDDVGRVTCPVLYRYRCPWCGATGEHAHTVSYCPVNPYRHSSVLTSRTPRKSCGCLRTCQHHYSRKH